MKDFYDVRVLAWTFAFGGPELASAVRATFGNRGSSIPAQELMVLSPEFLGSTDRQTQWRAFLKRGRLEGPDDAVALSEDLRLFVDPVFAGLHGGGDFNASWAPGAPWMPAHAGGETA